MVMNSHLRNQIKTSAKALSQGHLVIFPTETVYGLGADPQNEAAVKRIFEIKNRPDNHPLIVHISSINQLSLWARQISNYAWNLANAFWPGPMTLVLPRTELAKDFITGRQDTVAVRIPDSKIALKLINQFRRFGGAGVSAPSANTFGGVSPTNLSHISNSILSNLDQSDQVIDGGNCHLGLESTIISCTGSVPQILRPGFITEEMVNSVVEMGKRSESYKNQLLSIRVPGSHEKHYSPKARILLNGVASPGDGFIAMSDIATPPGAIRLMSPNTHKEFAHQLYSAFHLADNYILDRIIVIPPTGSGITVAINDRLIKAAANKNV